MGFPPDLVSFSTKLPSKRYGEIRVTFVTGCTYSLFCRGLAVVQTFLSLSPKDEDPLKNEERLERACIVGWCVEMVRIFLFQKCRVLAFRLGKIGGQNGPLGQMGLKKIEKTVMQQTIPIFNLQKI